MINRMLERLEAERCDLTDYKSSEDRILVRHWNNCVDVCKEIVQEVAKQYTEPVNKRCLTCANYDGEEIVDNICYLCCKGFEDNYVAKE